MLTLLPTVKSRLALTITDYDDTPFVSVHQVDLVPSADTNPTFASLPKNIVTIRESRAGFSSSIPGGNEKDSAPDQQEGGD